MIFICDVIRNQNQILVMLNVYVIIVFFVTAGSGVTCVCDSGYSQGTDGTCTVVTCGGLQCQNGASCASDGRCDCPVGFYGDDCSGLLLFDLGSEVDLQISIISKETKINSLRVLSSKKDKL